MFNIFVAGLFYVLDKLRQGMIACLYIFQFHGLSSYCFFNVIGPDPVHVCQEKGRKMMGVKG